LGHFYLEQDLLSSHAMLESEVPSPGIAHSLLGMLSVFLFFTLCSVSMFFFPGVKIMALNDMTPGIDLRDEN
jgi:hypothetical protein